MKRKTFLIFSVLFLGLLLSWRSNERLIESKSAIVQTRIYICGEIDSININLRNLYNSKNKELQKTFYNKARRHYKHIEFFSEQVSPRESKFFINGPLIPKLELEISNEVFMPKGFQKIEDLVYSEVSLNQQELKNENENLIEVLQTLQNYYSDIDLDDGYILELMQLQLVRFSSLSLNGYDATIGLNNLQEIIWSIEGMQSVLENYNHLNNGKKAKSVYSKLNAAFESAKVKLNGQDYLTFNRLDFIVDHLNFINQKIINYHNALNLSWNPNKKPLKLESGFLFGKESFDYRFFSIYYEVEKNEALQASLGKKLFFDPIMSGNNQVSCATCHKPELSFSDGLVKANTISGVELVDRNTPSLLNVLFQNTFFYDGRVFQLEGQVEAVLHNPKEMNSNFKDVIAKLKKSKKYRADFQMAFKGSRDTAITEYAIMKAITEYEKKMIALNSPFDAYLRGNKKALSRSAVNGYNLFAGKALCGSCHFFPIFNGTVPPNYVDTEFEVIGTPKNPDNLFLDDDIGHYAVTHSDIHKFSFKTPGLRNIEQTAPYMHNGVYKSLEEVVDFYHKGGGVGLGFELPNQTLPFDSLQLNIKEKADLIAFLKSLTDKKYYR